MTDEQIIKALECCSRGDDGCEECPLIFNDCVSPILTMERLMRDARSLINRQKEEIERLQRRISELEAELDDLKRDDLPRCKDALRRANEIGMAVDKANQELKAEIESLKAILNIATKAKAEAIKEFAERLKAEYADFDEKYEVILPENIQKAIADLIKEMVGDHDAD